MAWCLDAGVLSFVPFSSLDLANRARIYAHKEEEEEVKIAAAHERFALKFPDNSASSDIRYFKKNLRQAIRYSLMCVEERQLTSRREEINSTIGRLCLSEVLANEVDIHFLMSSYASGRCAPSSSCPVCFNFQTDRGYCEVCTVSYTYNLDPFSLRALLACGGNICNACRIHRRDFITREFIDAANVSTTPSRDGRIRFFGVNSCSIYGHHGLESIESMCFYCNMRERDVGNAAFAGLSSMLSIGPHSLPGSIVLASQCTPLTLRDASTVAVMAAGVAGIEGASSAAAAAAAAAAKALVVAGSVCENAADVAALTEVGPDVVFEAARGAAAFFRTTPGAALIDSREFALNAALAKLSGGLPIVSVKFTETFTTQFPRALAQIARDAAITAASKAEITRLREDAVGAEAALDIATVTEKAASAARANVFVAAVTNADAPAPAPKRAKAGGAPSAVTLAAQALPDFPLPTDAERVTFDAVALRSQTLEDFVGRLLSAEHNFAATPSPLVGPIDRTGRPLGGTLSTDERYKGSWGAGTAAIAYSPHHRYLPHYVDRALMLEIEKLDRKLAADMVSLKARTQYLAKYTESIYIYQCGLEENKRSDYFQLFEQWHLKCKG